MSRGNRFLPSVVVLVLLAGATRSLADDGRAELDKAMDLKFTAKTLEQLSEVVALCEKAIQKGLEPGDEKLAKKLLTGSLYQRAMQLSQPLLNAAGPNDKLLELRKRVLSDLEKIVKYDDQMGQAFLMIAQLRALAGEGERKQAREAVDKAITLLKSDKRPLANALLLRSKMQQSDEKSLADINRAMEVDPESAETWQMRAVFYLRRGEFQKAIDDFNTLLKKDSGNIVVRLAVAEALMNVQQFDESLKQIDRVIKERPNPIAFALRAQLWTRQKKLDKAVDDMSSAIKLAPGDIGLLMMRARLYHVEDRNALAKQDVDQVLFAQPGMAEAIELRSSINASLGDFDKAVADIETLVRQDPENLGFELQLAIYMNAAGQSRRAAALFSKILKKSPDNAVAFRGRADAYLNIGEHAKAIADYEKAIKSQSGDSWILNNLAWVLATSPDDALRDGKRAIELGRKACAETDYQEAHILSTLAAAYAEAGDFEKALKWSEKAVELSDDEIKDQLRKELESYRQKKPWRERKQEDKEI